MAQLFCFVFTIQSIIITSRSNSNAIQGNNTIGFEQKGTSLSMQKTSKDMVLSPMILTNLCTSFRKVIKVIFPLDIACEVLYAAA